MQIDRHAGSARASGARTGEACAGEARGEEAHNGKARGDEMRDDEARKDAPPASRGEWLASCGLTDREHQVVVLVMAGKTFQEVSECLDIAPSTAKTYFQRSLAKLGIDSREELAGQWAAYADAKATVDAVAVTLAPKTSRKDMLLAACQRVCVPALLVLGFLLPQRIVRDGCVGWPVALGFGIGLLVAGLFGRRIVQLHVDLSELSRVSPGRAALVRALRGTVVCACATCAALRAVRPVEAWLDGTFAFATALGAICLALCLAACPLADEIGEKEHAPVEMLARIMLCAICVLAAVVQPVANVALFVAAAASAWFLLGGAAARGFGKSASTTMGPTDATRRRPLDAKHAVISGAVPGKDERGAVPVWDVVAISMLATLVWAMAGSLGRECTLGVPALVGAVFCCAALLTHSMGEGKESLGLLAVDAVAAIAVGFAMGNLRCALVALPLVSGAFALGASVQTSAKSMIPGMISAGITAALAPPVASFYHTLATAPQTKGIASALIIVLVSIAGCAVLLPEFSHLLGGKSDESHRVRGGMGNATRERGTVPDTVALLAARGLSETQVAVLAAIYEGKTSREIASGLVLSRGAINSARRDGYRALGVHSAEDLRRLIESGN